MKQVFRKFVLGTLSSLFVLQACQTPSINTGESNKYNEKSSFNFKINSQYDDFTSQKTLPIPYTVKNKTDYLITYWLPEGGSGRCIYDTKETTESYNNKYITFWYNDQELKWYVFYDGATYPLSETGGEFSKNNTDGTVLYSGSLVTSTQNVTIKIKSKTESFYHWASNYMSGDYKSDVCPRPSNVYYFYDVRNTTTTTEFDFVESFPVIVPTPTPTATPTSTPTATPTSTPTPTPEPTPTEPNSCNTNSCPANLKSFSVQNLAINRKTKEINKQLNSLGIKNINTFKTQGFVGDVLTDFVSRIESAYQGIQLDSLVNDYKENINNANTTFDNALSQEKDFNKLYQQLDNLNNLLDKVDPHKKPDVFDSLVRSRSDLLMEINANENNFDNLLLNLDQILNNISNIEQSMNQLIDNLSSQPCQCIPVSVLDNFKNALDDYKDKMLNKAIGKGGGKNKIGEHYPDRVAKEMGLTKKERQELGKIIHKEKSGKRGDDNFDLETIRDFAREIIDRRK